MKSEISIGNVVEVTLNGPSSAFLGIVLRVNDTKDWKKHNWYEVQPLSKKDMPACYWYKESRVEKISETAQFLAIDGGKDD